MGYCKDDQNIIEVDGNPTVGLERHTDIYLANPGITSSMHLSECVCVGLSKDGGPHRSQKPHCVVGALKRLHPSWRSDAHFLFLPTLKLEKTIHFRLS